MNNKEITNKEQLKDLMQYIADGMKGYSEIRAGGNLGTAIQGYLQLQGADKIANQLKRIADALENKNKLQDEICGYAQHGKELKDNEEETRYGK